MLTTSDSLFLADVSSAGSMETGAHSGVIYQIKALAGQKAAPAKPILAAENPFASLVPGHPVMEYNMVSAEVRPASPVQPAHSLLHEKCFSEGRAFVALVRPSAGINLAARGQLRHNDRALPGDDFSPFKLLE